MVNLRMQLKFGENEELPEACSILLKVQDKVPQQVRNKLYQGRHY